MHGEQVLHICSYTAYMQKTALHTCSYNSLNLQQLPPHQFVLQRLQQTMAQLLLHLHPSCQRHQLLQAPLLLLLRCCCRLRLVLAGAWGRLLS
jgi:hypothetical protein